MFDGEIDRRGPAGDAAWTRMSEGESESELTDLTDSVGWWLSLSPRHTILLPPAAGVGQMNGRGLMPNTFSSNYID